MAQTVVGSKNLVNKIEKTKGVTLVAGAFTAGTILVGAEGGTFSLADVDGTAGQQVGILLNDVADTDPRETIIATGEFNVDKITFSGLQTHATIAGHLANKNITLVKMTKA